MNITNQFSKDSKILVIGNTGNVGSKMIGALLNHGYTNVQGSHDEDGARRVNVLDQKDIRDFVFKLNPDVVIMTAAHDRSIPQWKQMLNNTLMCLNLFNACIFQQAKACIFFGYGGYMLSYLSPIIEHANRDRENACKFDWTETGRTKLFKYDLTI